MAALVGQLDFVGDQIGLRFTIGQLVVIRVQMLNSDGSVQNINGRSYSAKIAPEGGAAIATFTCTIIDGPNGIVEFSYDSSVLATNAAGQYVFEAWEDSNKNYLWSGPVEILAKRIS